MELGRSGLVGQVDAAVAEARHSYIGESTFYGFEGLGRRIVVMRQVAEEDAAQSRSIDLR